MTQIAGTGSSNRIFKGQKKDFIVMRKDTFNYTGTYTYVDEDDTTLEYDFTDCVGAMAIKKKKTDTTAVRMVSVAFDVEEYTLFVDAEDMDMDAGKYYYDLQIYDASHEMVTKLYGDFIVLQDVTSMLVPEEEDIYAYLNTDISYQDGIKNSVSVSLNTGIEYKEGVAERVQQGFTTFVTHAFQLRNSEAIVISTTAIYQLMTQWGKFENMLSTEASKLITAFLDVYNVLEVEYSYIMYIND